jgi:hypothetical protein
VATAVGALAFGGTASAAAETYSQASTGSEMTATPYAHQLQTPNLQAFMAKNQPAEEQCTRIQNIPRGFYLGKACASNSRLIKLHNSYSRHFDYGIVIVDGVYKCGWVVAGTIPTTKPKTKPKDCQLQFHTLKYAYNFYKELNCPPGECDDGAVKQAEVPENCEDERGFENFATTKQSIFNLHPQPGNSGFSGAVEHAIRPLRYRARTRLSSEDGKAIVVRGNNKVHWLFVPEGCADQRQGGSPNDGQ